MIKKIIYIILGSITLALGVTGIILPILPTTPFLLLSAFFYVRSSKKLYHWLINHKLFGKYLYNYLTYKAIPLRAKIFALILIWITIPICCILINKMIVSIILPIIALTVSIYIIRLKTLKKSVSNSFQVSEKKEICNEIYE